MRSSRTLVIGDIHGGLKALEQVLKRAEVSVEDHLIFLGDYVDGWSDSVRLIDYLIALDKTHHCTFIKGNHDELCLSWLSENKHNPDWLKHGGQTTKEGYEKLSKSQIQEHILFYQALLPYKIDQENRLYLHAGFTNLHGPHKEYFSRMLSWDRSLWELALATRIPKDDPYYPKRLKLFKEVFIGHTPLTRIGKDTPFEANNVWNVDTGAAFTGKLTVMDVDTKAYWQSDTVMSLYPDEEGRNAK